MPPLITDIDLSVDDKCLYVSCWGTGELKQYDVSDPFHPRETGSVRLGGIVRIAHPAAPDKPLAGGPQMVEVSRDGKRIYVTNSLYGAWDEQFYPDGVGAWIAKLDTDRGRRAPHRRRFFPHGEDFRGLRVHQVRLQGGDASSDSYCYRSLKVMAAPRWRRNPAALLWAATAAAWLALLAAPAPAGAEPLHHGAGAGPASASLAMSTLMVATMLPTAAPALARPAGAGTRTHSPLSPCCARPSTPASPTSTRATTTGRRANQIIREALHPYSDDLHIVTKVGARRGPTGRGSRRSRPRN